MRSRLVGFIVSGALVAATLACAPAYAASVTYNARGQVASVTNDSGVTTYYCYDAAGNRTYAGPTAC